MALHPPASRAQSSRFVEREGVALLRLTGECNNRCLFCAVDAASGSGHVAGETALKWLVGASQLGLREVILTGGEPTLHPQFLRLCRDATRRGLQVTVHSNGRVFAYPEWVDKAVHAGVSRAVVSLQGPQHLHDAINQTEAYEQTEAGIRGLVAAGVEVSVRTVVSRLNGASLSDACLLAFALGASSVEWVALDEAGAARRWPEGSLSLEDAAAAVTAALDCVAEVEPTRVADVRVSGFPLCLLAARGRAAAVRQRGHAVEGTPTGGLAVAQTLHRMKPPACGGCDLYHSCDGVHVGAIASGQDESLRALTGEHTGATAATWVRGVPSVPLRQSAPEVARVDVHPRYPDTLLMTLMVAHCELACRFCDVPTGNHGPGVFSTLAGVKGALDALQGRYGGLLLTGGEPSGLPWLNEALAHARETGLRRLQMQTHCGAAADARVAEQWVEAGLTAVDVPLYGAAAAQHENITRTPGSFERTLLGMKRLRERGVRAVVHNTLFADNLGGIADWLAAVDGLGVDACYIQLAGREVSGPADRRTRMIEEAAQAVESALSKGGVRTPLMVADLPLCAAPGMVPWSPHYSPAASVEGVAVLPFSQWLERFDGRVRRTQVEACEGCSLLTVCGGVEEGLAASVSRGWPTPVTG